MAACDCRSSTTRAPTTARTASPAWTASWTCTCPTSSCGRADLARRYLAKRDYPEVARDSVREMHRQVGDLVLDEHGMARRGLLVRHLVMPGLLAETEAILRFVASELGPGTYVNVMAQYYPAGRARVPGDRPAPVQVGVR